MQPAPECPRTILVEAAGVQGFLAIDSTVNGVSAGGVRLMPGLSAGELGQLARVMTLKFGFLGLPCGGAKAGLAAGDDLDPGRRAAVFAAFGRALAPVIRSWEFRPAQDLGTTPADIGHMLRAAGLKRFVTEDLSQGSAYTGLSVAVAAAQAARSLGFDPRRLTFVVAGFGRVGSAAARELVGRGCRLVGLSTIKGALYRRQGLDLELLFKLLQKHGPDLVNAYPAADRMAAVDLLRVETDILCPCGGSFSVDVGNANGIQARIVCPGANLPLTDAAEKILDEKGIVCLPDFVANCGGVLGPTMLSAGLPENYVRAFIEKHLAQKVDALLAASARTKTPPGEIARGSAEEDFIRVRDAARRFRWLMGAARLGERLYRWQLIPRRFSAAFTRRYFEKKILTVGSLGTRNQEPA